LDLLIKQFIAVNF